MKASNIQDLVLKNGLKFAFAVIIFFTFLYILSPFIIPIVLGGILAMAFDPFVGYFVKKGLSLKRSMQLLSFVIFLMGVIPTAFFFIRGSKVITVMVKDPQGIFNKDMIYQRADHVIGKLSAFSGLSNETLTAQFQGLMNSASDFILELFSALISQIPDMALASVITILAFYFFLGNGPQIRDLFNRYFFFSSDNEEKFVKMVKSCCREVFFSNFLTGVIQACVVSLGALIAGVGDFFLIFFATFIFSFVPVIGAAPVAFLISLYAFFTQDYVAGIIMLVISGVAGLSDNLVRPYLASLGTVEVPAFIGFMAVIGGVIIFGLPGLFVAPLVASLAFGLVPIFYDEYLGKAKDEE